MILEPTDLVVNVFERTYRSVIIPGFFPSIEEQNILKFNKTLLINNVNDEKEAFRRADLLVARNDIDEWYSVNQYLANALEITGINKKILGRIPYYSTAPLVAAIIHKNPFLLYWDADIKLRRPHDWVTPGQNLLNENPHIFCVNPSWHGSAVEDEGILVRDHFSIGYGFSDQMRKGFLSKPIYKYRCPASFRYPLCHIAPYFESMVDSFTRTNRLLRATYLDAHYLHPYEGLSYPNTSYTEKVKRIIMNIIIKISKIAPTNNPCIKVNPKALDISITS